MDSGAHSMAQVFVIARQDNWVVGEREDGKDAFWFCGRNREWGIRIKGGMKNNYLHLRIALMMLTPEGRCVPGVLSSLCLLPILEFL